MIHRETKTNRQRDFLSRWRISILGSTSYFFFLTVAPDWSSWRRLIASCLLGVFFVVAEAPYAKEDI